jgi:hypothetical protein
MLIGIRGTGRLKIKHAIYKNRVGMWSAEYIDTEKGLADYPYIEAWSLPVVVNCVGGFKTFNLEYEQQLGFIGQLKYSDEYRQELISKITSIREYSDRTEEIRHGKETHMTENIEYKDRVYGAINMRNNSKLGEYIKNTHREYIEHGGNRDLEYFIDTLDEYNYRGYCGY